MTSTFDKEEAYRLIIELANMTKDGELDDEGEEFVLENDDAYDTVMSLIGWARSIVGQPIDREKATDG